MERLSKDLRYQVILHRELRERKVNFILTYYSDAMRYIITVLLFWGINVNAQNTKMETDSTKSLELEEVIITAAVKKKIETEMKMAVSVDEFLASSHNISFIKRGAYAWEPLLNNMSSERSTITIDGMHVFGRSEERRVGKECRSRWWTSH